jgi:hypothetical protein
MVLAVTVSLMGCGGDESGYGSCEDAALTVGAAWDDCVGYHRAPLCTGHPEGGCAAAGMPMHLCDACDVIPPGSFGCEDGSDWADTQAVVCDGATAACGGCE